MADRQLRIKSFSRRAAGSLARRVLYGSLALLAFPLVLHTLFLYKREYNLNIQDAYESLNYLAESRALYIEQFIGNQENLLKALEDDLPSQSDQRDAFLHAEAQEFSFVDEFVYLSHEKGVFRCENTLCRDPSYLPFLQQAVSQERAVFINPFSADQEKKLVVCKRIRTRYGPTALFCAVSSASKLLEKLTSIQDTKLPLSLSLINSEGTIFLSTDSQLSGTKLSDKTDQIEWIPYANIPNAWKLETPKGQALAVKIAIQGTSYSLLVDVPEKKVADLQWNSYFFRIGSFILLSIFLGGGVLFWFTHRVAKPLRVLENTMNRISEGALHIRYEPDRMGFEINTIGLHLNNMLDALLEHQQEAQKERIARERLAQELKIGQQIQASMLPTHLPDFPTLDIAPGYLPAREVSGDFYDFYRRSDGLLFIAIADGADKGISACLYSLSFRSMLRTAVETMPDLKSIGKTANRLLMLDTAESSFFITAWMALYDPNTRRLQYSSFGHPPAYLRKGDGNLMALSTDGMAFGIQKINPEVNTIQLDEDDLLFLYTDGIIEACSHNGKLFGKDRLERFLLNSNATIAEDLVEQILEEVRQFCKNSPQSDDLTLISIFQK